MTKHDPPSDSEWSPATSDPGELYTVEGQSRSTWAFLSGAKHRDPRGRSYRRAMMRSAAMAVGIVLVVVLAIAGIVALLD